nr:MAG TPA: hypothetical protein [Caudoviricetes sp.]
MSSAPESLQPWRSCPCVERRYLEHGVAVPILGTTLRSAESGKPLPPR